MGESISQQPAGSTSPNSNPSDRALLGFGGRSAPLGSLHVFADVVPSGPAPGQQSKKPAVSAPSKILFPSVSVQTPPSRHPALPSACPNDGYFGDPPTRKQETVGMVLPPDELAAKKSIVQFGIQESTASRPMSAANFQHWLDGTGNELVMAASIFQNVKSGVPTFLADKCRDTFEAGAKARLKDENHPQGTLLPAKKDVGNKGLTRFMQFRDGITAGPISAGGFPADLFSAVGSFNVHSTAWVQATLVKIDGLVFKDFTYDVEFLRWCVQIYDVYDWNFSKLPGQDIVAPFVLTDAQLSKVVAQVKLPVRGIKVTKRGPDLNQVDVSDFVFRDMEVSGVGRAYLIRSDVFEAPASVRGKLTIKL